MDAIFYTSYSTYFDSNTLIELQALCARKNAQLNITGYLYYADNAFMQYFEGESDNVDALYKAIANDQRHEIKATISHAAIPARKFPDWSMRLLTYTDICNLDTDYDKILFGFMGYKASLLPINVDISNDCDRIVWQAINKFSSVRTQI